VAAVLTFYAHGFLSLLNRYYKSITPPNGTVLI